MGANRWRNLEAVQVTISSLTSDLCTRRSQLSQKAAAVAPADVSDNTGYAGGWLYQSNEMAQWLYLERAELQFRFH